MNNYRVDRAVSDQREYALEGWPVRVCTGAPLIIETFADHGQLEVVTLLAFQEMKAYGNLKPSCWLYRTLSTPERK